MSRPFSPLARRSLLVLSLVLVALAFALLSHVLVPFVVAFFLAYLLNPVVCALQRVLRWRLPCVVLTMAGFFALLVGLLWLCVPPMVEELLTVQDVVERFLTEGARHPVHVPEFVDRLLRQWTQHTDVARLLRSGQVVEVAQGVLPRLWNFLQGAATTAVGAVGTLVSWLMAVLYLFFLMLDYPAYSRRWLSFVPRERRPLARVLLRDVEHYMGGYFRGQLLIALSNCVMFSLGLWLVGFPTPLALGCFIGLISFVPYLQVAGLLPATLLALLRAATTGQSFWLLMGLVLLVYVVVQVVQDTVVTPRVMGRIMGLSPAVILLSLSLGGALLGIGGLILALPVTTLALKYWREYVVGEAGGGA